MPKLKQFWNKLFNILDDVLAYILTIVGIMISNYIPLMKTNSVIHIEADWWRLIISAIIAIMIIGKQESLDLDENGSTEKAKAGRKKRFGIRMFNALSNGIAWSTMINMASN